MMDNNIKAIYITLAEEDGVLKISPKEISIREVFNAGNRTTNELYFSFESVYAPYQSGIRPESWKKSLSVFC